MSGISIDGEEVECPICHIPVFEVNGDGFDVMHCVSCRIVYSIKLSQEQWDYIPTLIDALETISGGSYN